MASEVLCVGDATLDAILTLNEKEAKLQCDLKKESCQICFDFSQKIPVEEVDFSLGGNAVNVAVGLKRLGQKVHLYSLHGDDDVGRRINEKIKEAGLDLTLVESQPGLSSYSTIVSFQGERTILEKKHHRHYELKNNWPKVEWLYVSSLGPDFQEIFPQIAKFVKGQGIKLGYNPWRGELDKGLETYRDLLGASFVFFVNKEEAQLILGEKEIEVKGALKKILGLGPKYAAITDGKKGAYASDGKRFYFCDIFPAQVVEATGAGDAFASGFFGALMESQDLPAAIKWGMVNSASVVGRVGAVSGLLGRQEIEERLVAQAGFGPVEI